MERGFHRFRRASQQLVRVTRRIFTICCCGEVETKTDIKVVSEESVLNGSFLSPKRQSFGGHSSCEHDYDAEVREHGSTWKQSCSIVNERNVRVQFSENPPQIILEPLNAAKHSSQCELWSAYTVESGSQKETPESCNKESGVRLCFAVRENWAQICPTEVEILGNLAKGNFGDIDLVCSTDGLEGKFIRKTITSTSRCQESDILLKCQSEYVVEVLACFETADATILYMPYYARRDLDYWLQRDPERQCFGENEANFITLHLLMGINTIHAIGVLHMDIKPGNIFLDSNGYPLLADFGGAVWAEQDQRAHCFTPEYSAPEVQLQLSADKMADLWSAACTFYEIITNEVPMLEMEKEDDKVITCRNIDYRTSNLSPLAADFVSSQLKLDKESRLGFYEGAAEVTKHPVFAQNCRDTVNDRAAGRPSPLYPIFKLLIGQRRG